MVPFFIMNISKKRFHLLSICLLSIYSAGCISNPKSQEEQHDGDSSQTMDAIIRQIELSTKRLKIQEFYTPNTLVYRYSSESCNNCISIDLDNLRGIKSLIGKENIKILPSFPGNRNDYIRLNTELDGFDYTNISNNEDFPKDPITGICARYFVYFGNNKEECYIYFPEKSTPYFTKGFLNWVVNKLFEDIKNNE